MHHPLPKRICVSPSRHPHIQKNLDTFKETFQKPSQIYKFLGETWKTNPLYLTRTLSYISKHRVQAVRKREAKIDVIAKKLKDYLKQRENGNHTNRIRSNHNGSSEVPNTGISKSTDNIYYCNWICNNAAKTSQKTRSYGFICPWCEKDYGFLDSLMAHLKCCHLRFSFNLVEEDGQAVIEMTLNSSFDGSYCGFKYPGHDMRRDFRFTPRYPERRTPITQIIYFRTKKKYNAECADNIRLKLKNFADNDSFAYDDDEADIDVCSGRLYYHTYTCLPVKPNEVDSDSEADMDPDWLRERTQLMIDEFTDVNEGEKEILKLWNLHIMKNYKYKGDNMIRQACMDFAGLEGNYIKSKNLTRNFFLHLANLFDAGLLSSRDMLECIRMFKRLRPPPTTSPSKSIKIKTERSSRENCQHSSPARKALINSH